MSLFVNTNVASLNAQRNLNSSGNALATSLQRLSSGLRVNSAKDDAAGLAIASGMNAQIKGSNQAVRNANDGISLLQTAEGTVGQIEANVQRIRELAVQAANGTSSTDNIAQIKSEVDELQKENTRLIGGTTFNGQQLFDTGKLLDTGSDFQIGAGNTTNDKVNVKVTGIDTTSLKSAASITLASQGDAQTLIGDMDADLKTIATARATMGALQNRFSAVVANLQTFSENQSASMSRIMDTDFAAESATLTRNQIIQQAGTAMLSQANQMPQAALSLLK
ncbi:flagellin N-terminal helical domain-containing protein [Pseudogulbenkiania subflava]|uniref:Flagellin n=1 Tax=Pseudogulbenkiania subflava DSM 22618 TaxID=1123014 RepID=A0A1Y6C170_9NEIS|nr:flagellin [Pseudogulbenkiania subflava]SMF40209.1 flagellin [Pseudogulbenkiania subflava DSM 22618]